MGPQTERLYKAWAHIRLLVIQVHDPKLRRELTRIAKAYQGEFAA